MRDGTLLGMGGVPDLSVPDDRSFDLVRSLAVSFRPHLAYFGIFDIPGPQKYVKQQPFWLLIVVQAIIVHTLGFR